MTLPHGLPEEIHHMLHTLWTKAVHQEGYDKTEWQKFEQQLHQLAAAS